MATYRNNSGLVLQLEQQFGQGGEGSVHTIASQPGIVAKIYHKPLNATKSRKLTSMVACRNGRLSSFTAWPLGTVHDGSGAVVGFTMRRIDGFKEAHTLYSPKSRRDEFPDAGWSFLIQAAKNLCAAFDTVHRQGHVIGDVNHGNILFGRDATCALIDCDSFQVGYEGNIFHCEVGVPTFTPPELQGRSFAGITRTFNHDRFGLAVLIFHLLFLGRHPFAGRFTGSGDMPIEKAISQGLFAYRRNGQSKMLPPPNAPTLSLVPIQLASLFERAFSLIEERPDPRIWFSTLNELSKNLKICPANSAHNYFNSLTNCPWCELESKTAVMFFGFKLSRSYLGLGKEAEVLWQRICSIPNPGTVAMPDRTILGSNFRPLPSFGMPRWRLFIKHYVGLAMIWGSIAIWIFSGFSGALFFICLIAFSWGLGLKNSDFQEVKETIQQRLNNVRKKLSHLEISWRHVADGSQFNERLKAASDLKRKVDDLPLLRKQELENLERSRWQSQLASFLDRFHIADASIPDIGPTRKAMLESYGIETAADVNLIAIDNVPGFGPQLAQRLVDWRKMLETGFRFNPTIPIDPTLIAKMEQGLLLKRKSLEMELTQVVTGLEAVKNQTLAVRATLIEQFKEAYAQLIQIEIDQSYLGL